MARATVRDKVAALVFYMSRGPRTVPELHTLIAPSTQGDTWVRDWLRAFEAEGLVRQQPEKRKGVRKPSIVWEWVEQ